MCLRQSTTTGKVEHALRLTIKYEWAPFNLTACKLTVQVKGTLPCCESHLCASIRYLLLGYRSSKKELQPVASSLEPRAPGTEPEPGCAFVST